VIRASESAGEPPAASPSTQAGHALQKGCALTSGPLLSLDTRSCVQATGHSQVPKRYSPTEASSSAQGAGPQLFPEGEGGQAGRWQRPRLVPPASPVLQLAAALGEGSAQGHGWISAASPAYCGSARSQRDGAGPFSRERPQY